MPIIKTKKEMKVDHPLEVKIKRVYNGFSVKYYEESKDTEGEVFLETDVIFEDANVTDYTKKEQKIAMEMKGEYISFFNMLFFLKEHFGIYDDNQIEIKIKRK